jgi:hypothetical protein
MNSRDENNIFPDNNNQVQKDTKLVDVHVANDNVALSLMVSFLSLAQRRGCFSFDESAKIWECIKMFHKPM